MMGRALAGTFGRRLAGVDLDELTAAAATLFTETPLTRAELARALAPRWPAHDPAALAYAATHRLMLVQVPPRGRWRQTGPDGAALLDLADAPAGPGPDVPAPPRFLPEYDNLLLSYAERARVIPHRRPGRHHGRGGAAAGLRRDRRKHPGCALRPGWGIAIYGPTAAAGRSGIYGRGMEDKEIMAHITELIATEHTLREQHAAGELTGAQEREQLRSAEEALDQCWDLLRQRRARREFGESPDGAASRPVSEVEGYQQ
jgi:uncharacterized protein DUF2630/winged helix DNA-binding protein